MSLSTKIVGKFKPPTNLHIETISREAVTAQREGHAYLEVIVRENKMADVAHWLLTESLPPEIRPLVQVHIGFPADTPSDAQTLLLNAKGNRLEMKSFRIARMAGSDVWIPASPPPEARAKGPSTREKIVSILESEPNTRRVDVRLDALVPPLVRDVYVLARSLFHIMAGNDAAIADHVKQFNRAFRLAAQNMGMPKTNPAASARKVASLETILAAETADFADTPPPPRTLSPRKFFDYLNQGPFRSI